MTTRGEPSSQFVRKQRIRVFVYEVSISVLVFLFAVLLLSGFLPVVVFLSSVTLVVLAGESWFAGAMRRASTMTWSDGGTAAPVAPLRTIGLQLLPNQPSGFHEPSLGRPFVWATDDGHIVALERDVVIGQAVVPAEVVFVTCFDPGRAVLMTYGDARPMIYQTRRYFLQSTGTQFEPDRSLQRHRDALQRLEQAGLRPRVVDSAFSANSMFTEFAVRPPSLSAAAGFTFAKADRTRNEQLRRPVWEQRDYRRRLERCLANAPAR